jgi:S1-C subfamily serine protease
MLTSFQGALEHRSGSAVVIPGPCILTAAHVVADATFLTVQRLGNDSLPVPARVAAVCHECDLALLVPQPSDAATFWQDLVPAELGPLPALRSQVYVAGFPEGGQELCITDGVVSRIEGQIYVHSQRRLLAATVDAVINAGNSGGPVFSAVRRVSA